MDTANFSDIEFVGIAAGRSIVINHARHMRRGSCSASSIISLKSVNSEVERHDRSIRASALNIREAYAVAPMSPSAFVVDLTPDTPVQLIAAESHHASSDDGHDFPSVSTWTSTPSVILPLERYRRDSQRHEQLAVSVCFGRTCELVLTDESVSDCAVFQRSLAPSPSTRRGLELSAGHLEGVHDSISTRSVVDLEDDDYQTYLRTYSLVRWFGATMEKTQELAIELQQDTVHPSRKEHASYRGPISCAVTIPSGCEPDRDSPSSSISLDRIEPDLALGAGGEEPSTDECLEAHKAAYKMAKEHMASSRHHTFRGSRRWRKRKSEESHQQRRPSGSSAAPVSDR